MMMQHHSRYLRYSRASFLGGVRPAERRQQNALMVACIARLNARSAGCIATGLFFLSFSPPRSRLPG